MPTRPPADAVVALRSLGRRFRGLFAGLEDDESPDDLGHRPGADGRSAVDHVVAATGMITSRGRDLQDALAGRAPGGDRSANVAPAGGDGSGTAEAVVAELAQAAGALADRLDHVSADDWGREGALPTLWDAVDTAVAHLRDAERTLAEVRGR